MSPATLQSPGEQNPLDDTMGVMLLGTIISAILYGASVVQTAYYFLRYTDDTRPLKLLVLATIVLDTAHMGSISHTMYHYLITHYYDSRELNSLVWSVIVESIFTGITAALVQFFYVWRVWLMSGCNLVLSVTIAVLIVAEAACGTAWVVLSLQMKTYQDLLAITPLTITINALSTAVDVLISGSLVLFLSFSKTGFRQTDTVISQLMLFFINTGLVTSLCAIAAMIALVIRPAALVYAFFYFCIGRLYCNSLLAALNARKKLRTNTRGRHGGDRGHGMASLPTEFSSAPAEFYHSESDISSRKLSFRIGESTTNSCDVAKEEFELVSRRAVI